MILAVGDIHAQIPHRRRVEQVMLTAQAAARRQEGCEAYTFAQALEEPGHFVVLQQWRDRAALDAHHRSAAFASYQQDIAPLLVRDSELRVHVVADTFRPVNPSVLDIAQDD